MLIGNYAVTDDFSISFDFTGDYNFDKQRGAIFWNFGGTMELSLSFPDMVWARNNNNIQWRTTLEGIGVEGYYYYKNNTSPINITAVYDRTNSEQRIYVDGYLLNSQSITLPPINATLELRVLEGASYDLFTGTISNVTFYNTALTLPTLPKPTPQYRTTDYPLNYVPGSQDYSSVNSTVTQLTNYQDPLFVGATDWTGSAINLRYLAGYDGDSASMTTPVINNALAIQTLLSDKFRFVHNVANLQEYYTENRPGLMAYDSAMISLAQANPGWTHQITSALAHMFDISPYTLIDPTTVTVATPLNAFNDTREIYEIMANYFATNAPGVTISRHLENDETLNRNNGAASRLIISQNFADRWTRMLEDLRALFPGVDSSTYDNCDTSFFITSGSTPIGIQADPCYEANDFFRGTVSHYTERPVYWRTYQGGNIRGLGFFQRVKYYDIQAGYELCTPYVAAGWNIQEEVNVRPGQWLGILKMLKIAGSQYFNAGYFTTGTTGVQDPKGYIWQAAMPAYCEGLFSDPVYRNIILNGNLMPGDMYIFWQTMAQPEYNFWTGDKSIFCVIRKLGTEYLIGLTYQPLNNYLGQPDNKDGIITFDSNTFTLNARVQGSVYYWDSSLGGSPTQIDTWHESFHPERWNSISPPPDVTPPVVDTVAGSLDVTIYCTDNTALLAALALQPTATDDIDPNPTILLISDSEINPGGCPNIRTRIWNFIDSSGNVSANFTQTIILIPTIPTSQMGERVIISKQLESSLVPGSIPVTDSQNEQFYLPPDTPGQVLTLNASNIPQWLSGSGTIVSLTRNEMLTLMSNSEVVPLQVYLITDRGDNGMLVKGVTTTRIFDDCIYIASISGNTYYDICQWLIGSVADPTPDDIIKYRKNLYLDNEITLGDDTFPFANVNFYDNTLYNIGFSGTPDGVFYGNNIYANNYNGSSPLIITLTGGSYFRTNTIDTQTPSISISVTGGADVVNCEMNGSSNFTFSGSVSMNSCTFRTRGNATDFVFTGPSFYAGNTIDTTIHYSNFPKTLTINNATKELTLLDTYSGLITISATDTLEAIILPALWTKVNLRIRPALGTTLTIKDISTAAVSANKNIILNSTLAPGDLVLTSVSSTLMDFADFEYFQSGATEYYRLVNYQIH